MGHDIDFQKFTEPYSTYTTVEEADDDDEEDGYDDSEDMFRDEVTEFSITFYTTVEFEEQTDDIPLFVDTAIADMNRT